MKNNHSVKNNNEARPIALTARRLGGLIGAAVFSGLLLAACGSDLADVGATVTALSRAEVKTDAATPLQHQRLDHAVVNQSSTAHESDVPGASIAAYER